MMPVSYRMNSLLRTLCLASVAFAPIAALAQDGNTAMPAGAATEAAAPAPTPASETAAPAEPAAAAAPAAQAAPARPGAPIAPGSEPNAGKPGEQVFITGNSTGVAAIVNDFVISNYDLDQRT